MIRLTKILFASLLLLTLNSQSDQQAADDDFLLQLLPAIISAVRDKESQNPDEPEGPEAPSPVASITATEIGLFRYRFDALLSPLPQGVAEYTWQFGDGRHAQGTSSAHLYEAAGEYSVQLEIHTANGAKYYAQKRIDIRAQNQLPVSNFNLSPSNGRAPLTVQFDASASFDNDGVVASYHWVFGDGATATGMQVAHEYQSLGIHTRYAATLTVIDDRQGQHKSTQYVIVNQADTEPVAHFAMNATEGTAPLIIKFDASGSMDLDGKIIDYHWDFGDGNHAEGVRTRHTYIEAGQFNPSVTVTDNSGDTHTFFQPLTVSSQNLNPHAVFDASSSASPATLTFNANGSNDEDGSIITYHWDFGDGHSGEGVMVTHIYTRPGDYTVTLFVTDRQGGIGIAQQSWTIPGVQDPPSGVHIISAAGSTSDNPYTLSGIAEPNARVRVYLDDALYQSVDADDQGNWQLALPLQDGMNLIKAETTQNGQVESTSRLLNYHNQLLRDLSRLVVDEVLVLTPGIPPLPYVISSADLEIAQSGKLVLQPGVEIQFNFTEWPGHGLLVKGSLEILGEANNKVHLKNDVLDENGRMATWSGIRVLPEARHVLIRHAVIDQAFQAIVAIETRVIIENTTINNSLVELIAVLPNSAIIDSQMGGLDGGISIYGNSSVSIQGNTFASDMNSIRIDCYASGCPIVNMSGNNLLMDEPVYLHANYVRLRGHQALDARGNWWGSTDIHQIGDPLLDTRGFLDGPIPQGSRFGGEIFDQLGLPAPAGRDLTLQAGRTYFAYSDITVPSGARLTLEAGATLRLDSRYSSLFDLVIEGELVLEAGARIEAAGFNKIRVDGGLFVNGSEQMPVVFTSIQDTPGHEDWAGILINSEAANIRIDHALIQHAYKGVSFSDSSGVLSNSELRDNKVGVWIEGNSAPLLTGNTITANETGISDRVNETIQGFQAQISRNNLAGNQQYAVYLARLQAADKVRSLRENWWGSIDIGVISEQIFDGYDTSNHPFVDYSDYLDGPVPEGEIYQNGVRLISLINADTTLTENEQIVVVGDVYIARGATLTLAANTRLVMPGNTSESFDLIVDGALVLEAGAAIEFSGTNQRIEVNGMMTALGSAENPIVFSSSEPNRAKDDWQGIHVRATTSHFALEHVHIQNAKRGIWFDGVSGEVHHTHFEQNEVAVLGSGVADPDLQANTFSQNDFDVQILGTEIDPDNQAPVAEFVSRKEAGSGAKIVQFNAGTSRDDDEIIAYHWTFSDDSHATGIEVSFDFLAADERVVTLTVLDNHGATGQISRPIRYNMVNTSPVADAGVDQIAIAGDQVSLDATGSHDDTGIVAYSWMQTQGPAVSLSDTASQSPSFIMPELETGASLMFQLTVTDAQSLTSIDTVKIDLNRNLPPLAIAGRDQSVEAGLAVYLDGAFSADPDGEIVAYHWAQSSGPLVDLLAAGTAVARFTMPDLAVDQFLTFGLTVTDNEGLMASDQLVISRIKEVTLNANVSSGIAPLNVSFRIDSTIPVAWVNMEFDGDGSIDISQVDGDQFTFRYELPGIYQPYAGIRDDQGDWYFDRITIVVSDPEQVRAAIKLEWDAMVLALLAGNIEGAMHYYSDQRKEEFAYMFGAMDSDMLQVIFAGVEDIQLNEVSGGYAEIVVLRRQNGQLYAYPVGMIKDENGVWKILKM